MKRFIEHYHAVISCIVLLASITLAISALVSWSHNGELTALSYIGAIVAYIILPLILAEAIMYSIVGEDMTRDI